MNNNFYDVNTNIANVEEAYIKSQINLIEQSNPGLISKTPLTIFTKETDKPNYYVNSIVKTFKALGIPVVVSTLSKDVSLETTLGIINNTVGCYVYARTDEDKQTMNLISTYAKASGDIDGLSYEMLDQKFLPAVVVATLKTIEHFNNKLALDGKTALIVNRSPYVGQPLQHALMMNGATTIMCNSTSSGELIATAIDDNHADIIIWATGAKGIGDTFNYADQLVIDLSQMDVTNATEHATFCKIVGRLTCLALAQNYLESLPKEPLTPQEN